MAETENGKKIVHVKGYTLPNGTKVPPHYRSTPDTAKGPKPPPKRRK